MDSAFAKNPSDLLRSVDPVWDRIREAAYSAAAAEPVLAGTLHATILSQPRFESALSYHLARLVGTTEVPAALIRQTFDEALAADPRHRPRPRAADIVAVADRDPAARHAPPISIRCCGSRAIMPFRPTASRTGCGRRAGAPLAHFLQSRSSALFGLDIHPGAVIGKSIFIDHGTGVRDR